MYRLIVAFGTIAVVASVMPMSRANAETTTAAANPAPTLSTPKMTPYQLAFMAYQGYFRAQGLRGYGAFTDDCNQGKLTARDVVEAAIKANQVPRSVLDDQGYMGAVDANLKAFKNSRGG